MDNIRHEREWCVLEEENEVRDWGRTLRPGVLYNGV